MKATNKLMKQMNMSILRNALKKCHEATKSELSAMTGLSVVTVNALVSEMTEMGELLIKGTVPSNGGRPSVQYHYNEEYQHAAIIYGHQHKNKNLIHIVVVNLLKECKWRREQYFDDIEITSFDKILDDAFREFPSIGMVAFGLPGEAVDQVITIIDYKKIHGSEFLSHYEERYKVPVIFENDINVMVYGKYQSSIQDGNNSLVGIYFPRIYEPGAGLILNGSIYYGNRHFSGELGLMPVPIPWDAIDYSKKEEILPMIQYLLAIFCCTVAPESFVLYGDFFTKEIEEELSFFVEKLLDGRFSMNLQVSNSMEQDYELGMITLALQALDEKWKEKIEQ